MDFKLWKLILQFEYYAYIYALIFVIGLVIIIDVWQRSTESWQLAIKIPGPYPLPILGNAHLSIGLNSNEVAENAIALSNYYGHVCRGFLGYKVIIFLSDPRDVEIILGSNVHLTKSSEYRYFKPWLGDGLLISNGEKWRSHRKLIVPAFHQFVLKSFIGAFNRNSWRIVKRLRNEVGKEFDVHDYMSELTVDILLETAMGQQKTHNDREGYDYAMAVMKLCEIIHKRQFTFYLRLDSIFKLFSVCKTHDKLIGVIHNLTEKVFRSKMERIKDIINTGQTLKPIYPSLVAGKDEIDIATDESADEDIERLKGKSNQSKNYEQEKDANLDDVGIKNRLAFLDLMIESKFCGANITEEEIKEEVHTIMFEGHDTTAAATSFVLCMLACHPAIQDKVYEEQHDIFGNVKRAATFTDILQMNYLERVILETLRLYPPVPVVAREIQENIKLASKDLTIPAGATVVICTYQMHRCADIYENPDKFDPDNFLPARTQNRNFYAFVPFSAGPRSCVGRKYAMLKMKILLSTIIRNYRITSSVREKDFKIQGDIILKRTDGFRIQVKPRC